jgi:hypothetical protein
MQREHKRILNNHLTKLTAILLAVMLVVSMGNVQAYAIGQNSSSIEPSMTFQNVTQDGGEDQISLSDARTFEVLVRLDDSITNDEALAMLDELTWSLSREEGMQDEYLFPYQYLGGELKDWLKWDDAKPFFKTEVSVITIPNEDGVAIRLELSNELFFNRERTDNPRSYRNVVLDYTGYYDLVCEDADGYVLGETSVRVSSYDSYRTHEEIVAELLEAEAYAKDRKDMYAEVRILGETADGNEMPYIIIADSKQTLNKYQQMKQLAETDPEALMNQIQKNTLDYKVPILYSNVHSDETPGSDACMNFIWDIVKSDAADDIISYEVLSDFTEEGQTQFAAEMESGNIHWSELLKGDDNEWWPTGLGFIKDVNSSSGIVDLEKFYQVETMSLDVGDLLDEVFFIIVPDENVDARIKNTRQNGNGFDLNRDNLFQTQPETRYMTKMIADWNPITYIELHGFVSDFQIEPCTPPHEPNIEYDLVPENGVKAGEAFGIAAIANNDKFNSYVMPIRDYLTEDSKGDPYWEYPWDDMSANYTPQYSMLHGTIAYTVEVPQANEEATTALEYGFIGHAAYVAEYKDAFFLNQLEGYRRGINNEDVEAVSDWYVDMYDNIGAEADVYRPKYPETGNFFPEYYVIPLDADSQKNLSSAYEMQDFLLRNGVTINSLKKDVTVGDTTYKKGSMVVNMYQAKRNVANAALYDGVLITSWTDLYSEPITAFGKTRGFDCDAITVKGAFEGNLSKVNKAEKPEGVFIGVKNQTVIISNDSIESVKAVNHLLDLGMRVGFITDGEYKGDFVMS